MNNTNLKDFVRDSKLLDAFSSFCERISYLSTDSDKNLESITSFKKALLSSSFKRSKLDELFPKPICEDSKPFASPSMAAYLPSTNDTSSLSMLSPQTPGLKDSGERDGKSCLGNFILQDLQEPNVCTGSSWTKIESTNDLLKQVNASAHIESHRVFSLLSSFSMNRRFNQPQESVFYALCFGFFERYLQDKSRQPQLSLAQSLSVKLNCQDSDFKSAADHLDIQLTTLLNSSNEHNLADNFYSSLALASGLYNSCIVLFKKILDKILEKHSLDAAFRKTTFKWMNDISLCEQKVYESIATLLETKLYFIVITSTRISDKFFHPAGNTKQITKPIFSVFIERSSNSAYILYPTTGETASTTDAHRAALMKRAKQRSQTPNLSLDYRVQSSPVKGTLNLETENRFAFDTPVKRDPQPFGTIPRLSLKKAATTNIAIDSPSPINTSNTSNTSNNFYLKPSYQALDSSHERGQKEVVNDRSHEGHAERVNQYKHNRSESYNYPPPMKIDTNSLTVKLAVKDQNPSITRQGEINSGSKESGSLYDRIMSEINQKLRDKSPLDLSREASQENKVIESRTTVSRNSPSNMHSRTNSTAELNIVDKNRMFSDFGSYSPFGFEDSSPLLKPKVVERPKEVLPNHIRTRVNEISRNLAHYGPDFYKTVSKYTRESSFVKKETYNRAQDTLLGPYRAMMKNTKREKH